MQIYLKKDVTNCLYLLFLFCYRRLWKTNFWCRGHGKVRDHEKENKARGLQKVIGVRRWDQEKVRLYKNCLTANNLCVKKALYLCCSKWNQLLSLKWIVNCVNLKGRLLFTFWSVLLRKWKQSHEVSLLMPLKTCHYYVNFGKIPWKATDRNERSYERNSGTVP